MRVFALLASLFLSLSAQTGKMLVRYNYSQGVCYVLSRSGLLNLGFQS